MAQTLAIRDHAIMARAASTGAIAGATIGAVAAAIFMLVCSLPFLLKCRRKRRLRHLQEEEELGPEMGLALSGGQTPPLPIHPSRLSYMSQSRLASAAVTLSDHDSQTGKEFGPDGITFHRSPAPSPALVGKTLRSCSPAPSLALAAGSAAASCRNSPAIAQTPFSPPAEKDEEKLRGRTPTFGTLTTEPEPISRSATESLHGPHSPSSISGALRKFQDRVLHRDSTRSSGSDSLKTASRSATGDFDGLAPTQTGASAPYLVDEKIPMGGAAEEYYSGAPLSPPEEPPVPAFGGTQHFLAAMAMPGAALAGVAAPHTHVSSQQQQQLLHQHGGQPQQQQSQQQSRSLDSPFDPPGAPLSPSSPFLKEEDLSSEEGERRSTEAKSSTAVSQPHDRGLHSSPSPKKLEHPPSPCNPAPGTVNPMDMMKPSTAAEQAAWVDTELWKMENSPPPQLENSPPAQFAPSTSASPQPAPLAFEPSPPSQPQSYQFNHPLPYPESSLPSSHTATQPTEPERPQFHAVVRHPTEMDITSSGQVVMQHEEQVISDTSSPGPEFDAYAYGPSPVNHIPSPETGFTESAYTESPSPRSSISHRPSSSYSGTNYLGTSPGNHSRPSSQGDGSPKPTSFACDICGRTFDQVHKLNHHKRYHERPHQCSQCDMRFGTKTHLDRHINDKHKKTRKFYCTVPNCNFSKQGGGKSFPRKDNWRRHMQNIHSVNNPPEPVPEDITMAEAA